MIALIALIVIVVWLLAIPFVSQIERGFITKYGFFQSRDARDFSVFFGTVFWPIGILVFLSAVAGWKVKAKIYRG